MLPSSAPLSSARIHVHPRTALHRPRVPTLNGHRSHEIAPTHPSPARKCGPDTLPYWSRVASEAEGRINNLELVRSFVFRSRLIQQVTISFSRSLDLRDRGMCAHFCDVVHAMVQKTPGLVVMITDSGDLCVVERCYVAQWPRSHQPLDDSNPLRRLAQNTNLNAPTPALKTANFGFGLFLPVGHHGHRAESIQVHSIILAEISAVHPAAPGQSFTLVKLNYEHMHWRLKIGCLCDRTKTWGSHEQLTAILPYLRLPTLRKISIGAAIHPSAFTQFFRNNNDISQIELEPVPFGEQPRGQMLTEYPVVLPKLEYLSCLAVEDLVPLLNSFTLPNHTTIAIPFDPFADALALRRSLLRLAQQTLSVNLILRGKFTSWRKPFNDEDLMIAGTLDCVTWLSVEVRTDDAMRALIPWLACFPQLETLCGTPDSMREEVKAALPVVRSLCLLQ